MVPGHLREKNGYFQMILSWKDNTGKRKSKSISTGLPVKGNKKKAEKMLMKMRSEFIPENSMEYSGMLFDEFLGKWLNDKAGEMTAEEYSDNAYYAKTALMPYFASHQIGTKELCEEDLTLLFNSEKQNGSNNKTMLSMNRTISSALEYAVAIGWRKDNPAKCFNPCVAAISPLFTDFLEDWLKVIKMKVKVSTYASYERTVNKRIIPYFQEHHPDIRLDAVTAKHLQEYYAYELNEVKLTANTIKHRHANLHKAFSYAYKLDLITTNPADKVELPKIEKYIGHFYNAKQIEEMFQVFKGDPCEFAVIAASFYGLRRSEVLGLKWSAIDFDNKTISIQHTVQEVVFEGKQTLVMSDSTKTKSSCRTLPLVPPFEELLLKMKAEQEANKKLCGSGYCRDYLDYIYVNEIGEIIKPGYLTTHFPAVLEAHNMPRIRFHDLRHSCASLLFAQGVSMKEIQAWLGHSTIGTTANIYTHLDENSKLASANAIISILQKK